MVKVLDEDQLRRKKALQEKREARKRAKAERDAETKQSASEKKEDEKKASGSQDQSDQQKKRSDGPCLEDLPEYALRLIFKLLSAKDVASLTATCKRLMKQLAAARPACVASTCRREDKTYRSRVKYLDLCSDEDDAAQLIEDSYRGGETGRVLPRGKYAKKIHADFCGFARFLEEIAGGTSYLSTGAREPIALPQFVQGRFASVSPEHSICRVAGGSTSGPGGSGLAAWGVGKRGQLGLGKRRDERLPRRLVGLGYGIRIVQVSAGGGLVRVAHSLLLTATGRVLSFGTGQYGALGHGYNEAKQLPDLLRPKYIESLNAVRCVCVSAGELHSSAVSSDGDIYSWGDGFCGQLGHGDRRPHVLPQQIKAGNLDDEAIANVSCGARHTLAVTEDGECWSWGLGHFGVLGRSYTPFEHAADAAMAGFVENDENEGAGAAEHMAQQPAQPAEPAPLNDDEQQRAELQAHLDLIANLTLEDSSNQCIPMKIESLDGIRIVGSSAGHRHSLLLDDEGALYSCGSGVGGCLGLGDEQPQMHPMKIMSLVDERIRIIQMSAGCDISMAVSSTGSLYGWGKTNDGRIGLGLQVSHATIPCKVDMMNEQGKQIKAADVDCGYVHSVIVGLDGTIHMCGGVGIDGEADGQAAANEPNENSFSNEPQGTPRQIPDFNIWHRQEEPNEEVEKKKKYQKYGKYEVRGRAKMLQGD